MAYTYMLAHYHWISAN